MKMPPHIYWILATVCVALITLTPGCSGVAPGEDPVVVRAQQTLAASFDAVDAFLRWERGAPGVAPDVRAAADRLRHDFPEAHRGAQRLLAAYQATRTEPARRDLDVALALLTAAQQEAAAWLSKTTP